MKIGIRISICAALAAAAITMAAVTFADFSPEDEAPAQGLMLGEYEGRLAIFSGGERLDVTDIELEGLRKADREKISRGIAVGSREELLELLEDLGS